MALDATRTVRFRCPRCTTDLTVAIEVNDGTGTAYVRPEDVTHTCTPIGLATELALPTRTAAA
jgi:hypothetical protein